MSTASEKAYEWVRDRILDGTLPGDSYILETTVCEATGVSRTPAREAFNRLEGERYVQRVPRRGAQVLKLTPSDLYNSFGARLMIETHAAREFCASSIEIPAGMRTGLTEMDELHNLDDPGVATRYYRADRNFHRALVNTLRNSTIDEMFEALYRPNQWGAVQSAGWLRSDVFVSSNRRQHHALIDALERRGAAEAEEILREHLIHTLVQFPVFPS